MHFLDDHEVELSDIISTPLPKLPIDVTVKGIAESKLGYSTNVVN